MRAQHFFFKMPPTKEKFIATGQKVNFFLVCLWPPNWLEIEIWNWPHWIIQRSSQQWKINFQFHCESISDLTLLIFMSNMKRSADWSFRFIVPFPTADISHIYFCLVINFFWGGLLFFAWWIISGEMEIMAIEFLSIKFEFGGKFSLKDANLIAVLI